MILSEGIAIRKILINNMSSEKITLTEENKPKYPEGLTGSDIELIDLQCKLQRADSKEQIEGFALAYKESKNVITRSSVFETITGKEIENLILHLASLIEKRNEKGYRRVPVFFASGGEALNPDLIPRAMESYSDSYAEGLMDSTEAYIEFEKIHPFEDGNGRLGDLLWKIDVARKTGLWPERLPPDIFAKSK